MLIASNQRIMSMLTVMRFMHIDGGLHAMFLHFLT